VGVPGELFAGGDGVALGYIGQPEMTKQSFVLDTFSQQPNAQLYRSGDRVRWRPDGVLEFLGRFDNQVKIRGHRIEPDDVAACLAEHESVSQAVVVPHLTAARTTELVAYVVTRNKEHSGPELRKLLVQHTSERLPAYMVPAKFFFLRELPLTSNGKLDLVALQDTKHDSVPVGDDMPLSSVEARILGILQDVLHDEDLGPDDDFFDAGGDSLLAITLMFRLEREFGKELAPPIMNETFTARRLAVILESPSALRATYPTGVVKVRDGTAERPLFCLPGLGSAFAFHALAAKMRTRRSILVIELYNVEVGSSALKSLEEIAETVAGRMREVQPDGPYAVVGYSFGGNLAVEVARQLTADGQTVELVTVLDAYGPSFWPRGLRKVAMQLRVIMGLNFREAYAYIFPRIQGLLFSRTQRKSEIVRQNDKAAKNCLRAHYARSIKSFSGRIVLMLASDLGNWREVADPSRTYGWSSVCKDGVKVIPLACGHLDILKNPHVTVLAGHIDDLLNAIDR